MLLKQEYVLEHGQAAVLSSRAGGGGGSCKKLPGHSESKDRANLGGRM